MKPILCLDFDGTCHSYTSGWKGATVIPDSPVPGLFEFLAEASKEFDIYIFSSRSATQSGRDAMGKWFSKYGGDKLPSLCFATSKPPAFLTLDDRALTFNGEWPDVESMLNFKSWQQ